MNATAPSVVAPRTATARDFTRHLADLLRKEHGAMVNFLLALSECDGRRLWADLGYASLFDYLHRELQLSRSAAYYRSAATSLVQRYPEIADALADGRLCLTSLAEISKVITPANAADILPRFFHRSSREAKDVVAEIAPHPAPPRREVVTAIRPSAPKRDSPAAVGSRSPLGVQALGQIEVDRPESAMTMTNPLVETPAAALIANRPGFESTRVHRDEVEPLTASLRRIHITVTKQWMEKLDAAKAALSHSIPSGSAEEVLEAALDALLEREAKRKGLVKNPRKQRPAAEAEPVSPKQDDGVAPAPEGATVVPGAAPEPRKRQRKAVPAHVRREVLIRDEQQCQAKLHDGSICGSRVRLEFEHVHPDSLGGPTTIENGMILCRAHNKLAASRVFGEQIMDLFGERSPAMPPGRTRTRRRA